MCMCVRVRLCFCGNGGERDELEEWDPPQCWPRAESEVMNRALRLPCAERGEEEIKCKMKQGKQKKTP